MSEGWGPDPRLEDELEPDYDYREPLWFEENDAIRAARAFYDDHEPEPRGYEGEEW